MQRGLRRDSSVTSASPYTFRQLATDDAALAAYRELLGVTSAKLTTEYLRWLYRENPSGEAVGFDAYAGDTLAAHYATIPVEAIAFGRRVRGLLSLNTATHPTHQGKGLFTRLAEQTYARAHELGFEFVVGVANANSTPGFTRKLGFQLVTPLDVLVGIGRFTASRDDSVGFSLAWSDAALRWRLGRPQASYVATTGAAPIVYARTHKHGILAYLAHVPAALARELPPVRLAQPFRMWIGIDPQLGRRGVLAPLPDRFKPSPLNLIYRDLATTQRSLSRGSTRFTLLDFDAY